MTNKRKPIRRETRCLYKALLKEDGVVLNLRKMIGFYEDYNKLRIRALTSDEAPMVLKANLVSLKMPKYLKWAKKYLIKGGKR